MPATSILISAPSSGISGIGNSRISVVLGAVLTAASTCSILLFPCCVTQPHVLLPESLHRAVARTLLPRTRQRQPLPSPPPETLRSGLDGRLRDAGFRTERFLRGLGECDVRRQHDGGRTHVLR